MNDGGVHRLRVMLFGGAVVGAVALGAVKGGAVGAVGAVGALGSLVDGAVDSLVDGAVDGAVDSLVDGAVDRCLPAVEGASGGASVGAVGASVSVDGVGAVKRVLSRPWDSTKQSAAVPS